MDFPDPLRSSSRRADLALATHRRLFLPPLALLLWLAALGVLAGEQQVPEPLGLEQVVDVATKNNRWLADLKAASDEPKRRLLDMELRQQALELLLRLESLAAVRQYAITESLQRDLKLEESRTLYEQEVKSDLGYSMSQQTLARLREQRVAYCEVPARSELNALQQTPLIVIAPDDRMLARLLVTADVLRRYRPGQKARVEILGGMREAEVYSLGVEAARVEIQGAVYELDLIFELRPGELLRPSEVVQVLLP